MLTVVITFFWLSILLYILLGGADFGAGILELFSGKANADRTRKLTYHTIGPVWEANHMWLIIAVVILFVAFPKIYAAFSTYMHLPVLLMLGGIIARGTAFIFRHYDAYKHDRSQNLYNLIFMASSLFTPFILGMIGGAMISHSIDVEGKHFADIFIRPWITPFSISTGILSSIICTFLAATYLIGEAKEEATKNYFRKKGFRSSCLIFFWGGIALITGKITDVPLLGNMIRSYWSIAAVLLAGISLAYYWFIIGRSNKWRLRLTAGAVVTFIMAAAGVVVHPEIITFSHGAGMDLYTYAAEPKTIRALGWALILGSIFILPGVAHLIISFQVKD